MIAAYLDMAVIYAHGVEELQQAPSVSAAARAQIVKDVTAFYNEHRAAIGRKYKEACAALYVDRNGPFGDGGFEDNWPSDVAQALSDAAGKLGEAPLWAGRGRTLRL